MWYYDMNITFLEISTQESDLWISRRWLGWTKCWVIEFSYVLPNEIMTLSTFRFIIQIESILSPTKFLPRACWDKQLYHWGFTDTVKTYSGECVYILCFDVHIIGTLAEVKIFLVRSPIDNMPALVHIMVWCQTGNIPLFELMMTYTEVYMRHLATMGYTVTWLCQGRWKGWWPLNWTSCWKGNLICGMDVSCY